MADLKCKETIYITPPKLADPIRSYFPDNTIPLDAATQPDNPLEATQFCTKEEGIPGSSGNGLDFSWSDVGKCFVNPPYGRGMKDWCAKIHEETVLG